MLRGHGLLGALRPPNEHVLGLRGERLLHEDIALGLGILLEREGGREKVAAGKCGRCLAYDLLRIREVAGGSIWLESVGSRDGHTVGLHIDKKVSRATRHARHTPIYLYHLRSACTQEAMTASWPFWYKATDGDSSVL